MAGVGLMISKPNVFSVVGLSRSMAVTKESVFIGIEISCQLVFCCQP